MKGFIFIFMATLALATINATKLSCDKMENEFNDLQVEHYKLQEENYKLQANKGNDCLFA